MIVQNILNLEATKGDFFEEDVEVLDFDDLPFDFSGYTAKMEVRKQYGGPVFLTFNTTDDSIELTEGNVRLYKSVINLQPSTYAYDLKITADGETQTLFKGSFIVYDSITQ